jgi:hypothetical protein
MMEHKETRVSGTWIEWSALRDRHVRGESGLGPVWIRLDRAGLVSGIYLAGEKWCPGPEERLDLPAGKRQALGLVQIGLAARELAGMDR